MTLVAAVLAALVGLVLGLLGGGGSILTVPVLVYVLGFEAKEAIAASLAVVGATSLLGALGHWRAGNVDLRVAAVFGAVAMAGTYLGARLSTLLTGAAQLTLFAVVMLVAAYLMFRPATAPGEGAASADAPGRRMPPGVAAAAGLPVGVLTGLVGVGGGFLIVPALVLLGRVPMRRAVGTSLLVIAMSSASGLAGYAGGAGVPWGFLALFTAAATGGVQVGTRLAERVPQAALRRAFAIFLLVMGTLVLLANRGVFLPGPVAR